MIGGVTNEELNERSLNILGQPENDSNIQNITSLSGAEADPDIQNQAGKTPLYYLDEELSFILGHLEKDINLLDYSNNTLHIISLLKKGANPNIQGKNGKTLLHYVAERNDVGGIHFLLNAKANPYLRDQSEKTPFEYVTEHNCRQAIKGLGYDLDNSRENEESPAKSPNNENWTPTDQQTSSERPDSSDSDRDSEDEDSSCSSSDYLFLEDSLLAKLEIPLTTDEQKLIDKFHEKIRGITKQNKQEPEENILKSIEQIVENCLNKGIKLNSSCSNDNENDKGDKETVTNLILEEIDNVLSSNNLKLRDETGAHERQSDGIADQDDDNEDKALGIIKSITSKLLLKGGKARQKFFFGDNELAQNYEFDYINNLSNECEEIESKLKSIAHESIVNKNNKQIHEYDFKAEIDNGYFCIEYPQDSIIEPVKIFNKAEDLKDKGFEKNGSVSTETTKDDLSTNLTQVRLQQNREVALGG
ncbi:MAG: ankyrin repeat domain-containing protein [Wolbachia sp.]